MPESLAPAVKAKSDGVHKPFHVVRELWFGDELLNVWTDHETCAEAVMELAEYIVHHEKYGGDKGGFVTMDQPDA